MSVYVIEVRVLPPFGTGRWKYVGETTRERANAERRELIRTYGKPNVRVTKKG